MASRRRCCRPIRRVSVPRRFAGGAVLVVGSGAPAARSPTNCCVPGAGCTCRSAGTGGPRDGSAAGTSTGGWRRWAASPRPSTVSLASMAPFDVVTGVNGGYDVNVRHLAADGVRVVGRVVGASDGRFRCTDSTRTRSSMRPIRPSTTSCRRPAVHRQGLPRSSQRNSPPSRHPFPQPSTKSTRLTSPGTISYDHLGDRLYLRLRLGKHPGIR